MPIRFFGRNTPSATPAVPSEPYVASLMEEFDVIFREMQVTEYPKEPLLALRVLHQHMLVYRNAVMKASVELHSPSASHSSRRMVAESIDEVLFPGGSK